MVKNMTQKQFESWARKIITEYQQKLCLSRHHITIVAADTNYMETGLRPPYLDVEIRYNLDKMRRDWKERKEELKFALVHELCHVFTDHFYCKATNRYTTKDDLNDERETMVDHITQIIRYNKL
jgi:hypothetical protein